MRLRVVCGLGETMATLRPTSLLTSVDLPALGRPTMATNPDLNGMQGLYAGAPQGDTRDFSLEVLEGVNDFLAACFGVIHGDVFALLHADDGIFADILA